MSSDATNTRKVVRNMPRAKKDYEQSILPTRTPTPHKCGLLYFYHIVTTGGTSIVKWLLQQNANKPDYVQCFGWGENAVSCQRAGRRLNTTGMVDATLFRERLVSLVNESIQNLSTWKAVHVHHFNNGNNVSFEKNHLSEWKATVESQGCKFLGIVSFRDPLEHTLANFRWKLRSMPAEDYKPSQLDYFLYNYWENNPWNRTDPNPWNATRQDKVTRALTILDQFYDIVVLDSNFSSLVEQVTGWTGWNMPDFPHHNSGKEDRAFSKNEIKRHQKRLAENGDFALYYALKRKYTNELAYLP